MDAELRFDGGATHPPIIALRDNSNSIYLEFVQ